MYRCGVTLCLWNSWNGFKYIKWLPQINERKYGYWNLSWLCFSFHIDKKGV